jgi:hypothetical protein
MVSGPRKARRPGKDVVRRPTRSTVLLGLVVLLLATVPVLIPLLVTKAGGAPVPPAPQALVATATGTLLPQGAPATTAPPPPRARGLAPTPSPTPTPTPSPTPSASVSVPAPTTTVPAPTTTVPAPPSPTPTVEARVLAAGPDLVVVSVGWIPGPEVTTGESVTFTAVVRNTGTDPTPDRVHGVAFAVDGAKVTWSAGSSQPLGPGETRTYTADGGYLGNTWLATPGPHTITATVDDVDRIPETNETDNTTTTPLTVTP